MVPIAYLRSNAAFEIEETLKFAGLTNKRFDERIREKVVSNKTYYKMIFNHGEIHVYSPKFILINKQKYKSIYEARRKLLTYI
jgi:hypothetical protein